MDWLSANVDWIFSGFGMVVLSALVALFKRRKRFGHQQIENATVGVNIQAGNHSVITLPAEKKEVVLRNPHAKYVGTLIDFFDEVTKDKPLDTQIAADQTGKVVLFYNRPLAVHLKRIEYFSKEKSLVFLSERNHRRDMGLPISDDVVQLIRNSERILLVRLSDSLQPLSEIELPFRFYE